MVAFLTTRQCRRGVMSEYLDGERTVCLDGDFAPCDRCGKGVVDWQQSQRQVVEEWWQVRLVLDSLADGCPAC
jgi:hypothetical protein